MIYDITQEIFSAEVYPGDPVSSRNMVMSFEKEEPDICQLTELAMGSHTGTHMDAPRHFIPHGKAVSEIELEKCIGACKVAGAGEIVQKERLQELLQDSTKRLLLKGAKYISPEAAEYLVEKGIECIGIESLSIAPLSNPKHVHQILLEAEIVILEGLDLKRVPEGIYELIALPLKMDALDGSPVRAVLRKRDGLYESQ